MPGRPAVLTPAPLKRNLTKHVFFVFVKLFFFAGLICGFLQKPKSEAALEELRAVQNLVLPATLLFA